MSVKRLFSMTPQKMKAEEEGKEEEDAEEEEEEEEEGAEIQRRWSA
jgi:hypothetical protein